MTQTQLNRAVARATGESVETIQRLGFSAMTIRTHPCRRRHGRRSSANYSKHHRTRKK